MNRIKEARKKAGMKQTDLCVRLGISQGALSGWENGKYEPDNAGWLTLSQCLNVSIDYLMGVSDEPSNQKEASASKCESLRKHEIMPSLSKDELNIIEKYRCLDERGRSAVLAVLNHEYGILSELPSSISEDAG